MRTRWHDVSSSCTAGCRKFIGTKTSSGLWVCLCARVCSRAHTKDFRANVMNNSNCHPLPAWALRAALQVRVCVSDWSGSAGWLSWKPSRCVSICSRLSAAAVKTDPWAVSASINAHQLVHRIHCKKNHALLHVIAAANLLLSFRERSEVDLFKCNPLNCRVICYVRHRVRPE